MERWESHRLPSNVEAAAWHNLLLGTVCCGLAVFVTLLVYLELWSVLDLVSGTQQVVGVALYVALGLYLFHRGEGYRWYAQLALSRLSDYRRRHGALDAPEPVFGRLVRRGRLTEFAVWFAAGSFLTFSGVFAFSACFFPPPGGFSPPQWWLLRAGLVLLGVFHLVTARNAYRRAVRLRVGVIPSFTPLPAGSYALYLRNFSDDPRLAKPFPMLGLRPLVPGLFMMARSEEERIEAAFRWAGSPVVAVGVPGERAPNNAILRMHLPRDWHGPVRTLMRDARLVVLVLGSRPGTLWELGEAMLVLPPERLVLVNPMKPPEYAEFRELARQALRERADEVLRTTGRRWTPPELPDPAFDRSAPSRVRGVVYFDGDWRATYVALPHVPPPEDYLLGSLDRALWAPMVQLTAHEQRVGAPHG